MAILSEVQKLKIKEEFYKSWKSCGHCLQKLPSREETQALTSCRQPMLFVLHEVIRNANISDEINYRPHKDIHKLAKELELTCATCKTRLSAYSEVGKYIGDDRFWHSFSYLLQEEKMILENYLMHSPSNKKSVNTSPVEKGLYKSSSKPQPVVACIDDSPQILKVMKLIFEKENYKFIGIQEPLQAVPKLITTTPDLIFLDINMPIINGYEICAQLRRVSKLKDKPVIMLTAKDGLIDRMRAKVVGSSSFVPKPIDTNKILDVAQKFLSAVPSKQKKINSSNEELIMLSSWQ